MLDINQNMLEEEEKMQQITIAKKKARQKVGEKNCAEEEKLPN